MRWHQIFFFLLLVFLPTQLGYHFWPDWAMVLGRRVDYLSPTVFLTDLLILLTVGSWFFTEISNIKNQKSKIQIKNQKLKLLFLAVVFVLINIFVSEERPVAIYKWLKVAEFVALGWYVVKTKPPLSFIAYPMSLGLLYSSVLAIAQFLLQHSIGGPLWWLGERIFNLDTPGIARFGWFGREILRPYAMFPHPNVLGGYLAAILPLIIIQLTNNPILKLSNIKKTFYLTTLALGMVALGLTFSRSAITVGIFAIGLTLWQTFRKKRYLVLFFAFVLLIAYCLLIIAPNGESFVVRQQLNDAAIKIWQQSPIIGVGLGNFLVELPKALTSRSVYFLQPAHNIYILVLAETGVVGLILLLYLLWRVFRKRPFGIYHLSFGILLILGLVDHYLLTLQQGQLLLTLFVSLNLFGSHNTIRS